MKTPFYIKHFLIAASMLFLAGCKSKPLEKEVAFPPEFADLDDASMVEFMMKNSTPDSVARFVCDAALGKVKEGRIDTLAIAAAYAYEHYSDSDLVDFSREFDSYSANLPLEDKMKIYSMAGTVDPQGLGYELGLEYVSHIREQRMNVADVKKELEAFKKACAEDSVTYVRFMKGFKTVLKADHGKDLAEEIYEMFINY